VLSRAAMFVARASRPWIGEDHGRDAHVTGGTPMLQGKRQATTPPIVVERVRWLDILLRDRANTQHPMIFEVSLERCSASSIGNWRPQK